MSIKQELIDHLRELANGEIAPLHSACGLCTEMEIFGNDFEWSIRLCYRSWKHFSGEFNFPIGNGKFDYIGVLYKWNETTTADLRRDLCDHVADVLEECGFE